jgi:hypothetical protein
MQLPRWLLQHGASRHVNLHRAASGEPAVRVRRSGFSCTPTPAAAAAPSALLPTVVRIAPSWPVSHESRCSCCSHKSLPLGTHRSRVDHPAAEVAGVTVAARTAERAAGEHAATRCHRHSPTAPAHLLTACRLLARSVPGAAADGGRARAHLAGVCRRRDAVSRPAAPPLAPSSRLNVPLSLLAYAPPPPPPPPPSGADVAPCRGAHCAAGCRWGRW